MSKNLSIFKNCNIPIFYIGVNIINRAYKVTSGIKINKEGLRRFNHSVHGAEVINYSELVKRGEKFIKLNVENYAK